MSKQFYFPSKLAERKNWLAKFKEEIASTGASLGLSADDVKELQDNCDLMIAGIDAAKKAQDDAKSATAEQRKRFKLHTPNLFAKVKSMKVHTAYTEATGIKLGVEGSENAVLDEDNFQPEISAKVIDHDVRIDFNKYGVDGVNIYTRLSGETKWNFLALDLYTPYIDTRATGDGKAETREYMAKGVLDDHEIGIPSKVINVVIK